MDRDQILEELEKKKRHSRIMAKRILTVFLSAVIITAVLFGVLAVWQTGWFVSENSSLQGGYIFDPNADYNYDIMKDEDYLAILDSESLIYLSNAQTGVTESLSPDEYEENGAGVALLTKLVKSIQMGDADTYNSCFSRGYLIAEGKRKASASDTPEKFENYTDDQYAQYGREVQFTMQQIYSVYITLYSETSNETAGTKTYVFELKYKIRKNNGTLRTDMGSDAYRPQEITLIEDLESGNTEIVSVNTFYSGSKVTAVRGWRVALVAFLSVLIIAADIVLTVILMKKINRSSKDLNKKEENETNVNGEKKDEETLGN